MTDSEREAVARAIAEADDYLGLNGNLPDWRPRLLEADAAIAALDAHRAGQVCVRELAQHYKFIVPPHEPPFRDFFASPAPAFCPDCGKRVEVRSE